MKGLILILSALVFIFVFSVSVNANDTTTVEAHFQGYGQEISMEVPDYINLGNFDKNNLWNETSKVYVNNTGGYTISVTPELSEDSPGVFENLGFRESKTKNGIAVDPTIIGDYTFNITKNNRKGFYMSLNITDFNGTLPSDDITLNAKVKFVATAIV